MLLESQRQLQPTQQQNPPQQPQWLLGDQLSAPPDHSQPRPAFPTNRVVSVLGAQFKHGHRLTVPARPQPPACDQCSDTTSKLHRSRRALHAAGEERAAERAAHEAARAGDAEEIRRLSQLLAVKQAKSRSLADHQAAGRRAGETARESRAAHLSVAAAILCGELASAEDGGARLGRRAKAAEAKARAHARLLEEQALSLVELRLRIERHEAQVPRLRLALLRLGAQAAESGRAERERERERQAETAREAVPGCSELYSGLISEASAVALLSRAETAEAELARARLRLGQLEARAAVAEGGVVASERARRQADEARAEAEERVRALSGSASSQQARGAEELGVLRLRLAEREAAVLEVERGRAQDAERSALELGRARADAMAHAAEATRSLAVRELLGSIRVAVLAPCVKLVVDGEVALRAGSPSQLDFQRVKNVLEKEVLARWSRVAELAGLDGDVADAAGPTGMFPELAVTMQHVTREVSERLVGMIKSA